MHRVTFVIPFFILACSSTEPEISVPDAGDAGLEDVKEESKKECEPLSCQHPAYLYCGTHNNECGETINCGSCKEPFSCGTRDLQDYKTKDYTCGLDCIIDKIPSSDCPKSIPIGFSCKSSKSLIDYFISDEWEKRYYCDLRFEKSNKDTLYFCCGL